MRHYKEKYIILHYSLLFCLLIVFSCNFAFAKSKEKHVGFFQNCRGYLLRVRGEGLVLLKDTNGTRYDGVTWCDADIGAHIELERKVLQKCSIGKRCHIKGYVVGHGIFHWEKIDYVDNLEK